MKTLTTKTIVSEHGEISASIDILNSEIADLWLKTRSFAEFIKLSELSDLILCLQEIQEAISKEGDVNETNRS